MTENNIVKDCEEEEPGSHLASFWKHVLAVAVGDSNGGCKGALGVCPLQMQVDAGQLGQQLLGSPPELLRVLHLQLSPVGAYRKDTKPIQRKCKVLYFRKK